MEAVIIWIPFVVLVVVIPLMYGAALRQSARLLKYDGVSWKRALTFSFAITLISIVLRAMWGTPRGTDTGAWGPAIGVAIHLGAGALYFWRFALSRARVAVGAVGGLRLTGLAIGVLTVIGLALSVATRVVLRWGERSAGSRQQFASALWRAQISGARLESRQAAC